MILLAVSLALGSELVAEAEVIDAGMGAVGAPIAFTVQFTADGDVAIGEIAIQNNKGTSFTLDGAPSLDVSSGVGSLNLLFTPSGGGGHSATLVVSSNADCAAPTAIELRGTGIEPCIEVSPRVLDFGPMVPPDVDRIVVRLRSCDGETWTVNSALSDNSRFVFGAATPFNLTSLPSNLTVQYTPVDQTAQDAVITLGEWGTTLEMFANDCENGNPANYDLDGDGTSSCGTTVGGFWADADGDGYSAADGDCDDSNPAVNPAAEEQDGGDDNCNGRTDEHLDFDGDGNRTPDDCDDRNAWVNAGEVEVLDGLDNNCNGQVDEGLEPATCAVAEGDEKGCGCSQTGASGGLGLGLLALLGARRR